MGIRYEETLKLRKVQPMIRQEIVDFYSTDGHAFPARFKGCEEARREQILQEYSPDERNIFKR